MPTKNPRITVTLTPELHAVLRRLSQLTDESQSALVGDLLQQSMPVFERMVQVLEAAHLAKESLRTEVAASLDKAQTKLEGQLGLVLETFDEGVRPLLDRAEKIKRRGARAGDAGAAGAPERAPRRLSTPMSNRGVTPHQKGPGKAKSGSAKGGR